MKFRQRSPMQQPPQIQEQPQQRKITVEELLHFKRAERPPTEFWAQFETQLKQRQLAAAIQEKRSWWHALPRIAIALPVGATAAIAIGFIVWRNGAPQPPAPQSTSTAENIASTTTPTIQPTTTTVASVAPQPVPAPQFDPTVVTSQKTSAAQSAATQTVAVEHLDASRNAFATTFASANPQSQRSQSINLFNSKAASTTLSTSTAALFAMPIVLATELHQQSQTYSASNTSSATPAKPSESADPRRERLLTYAETAAGTTTSASNDNPRITRLRDRVTSRFNDKTLSDTISRIGATGESLTIKF